MPTRLRRMDRGVGHGKDKVEPAWSMQCARSMPLLEEQPVRPFRRRRMVVIKDRTTDLPIGIAKDYKGKQVSWLIRIGFTVVRNLIDTRTGLVNCINDDPSKNETARFKKDAQREAGRNPEIREFLTTNPELRL